MTDCPHYATDLYLYYGTFREDVWYPNLDSKGDVGPGRSHAPSEALLDKETSSSSLERHEKSQRTAPTTIPSFDDFLQLEVGQGLDPIAVSPTVSYDYENQSSSEEDTEDNDHPEDQWMQSYEKVRDLLGTSGSEVVCGASSRRETAMEPVSASRANDETPSVPNTDRRARISNFSSVAPAILAELKRQAGEAEPVPGKPVVVTSKDLAEIREVIRNPAKLNPICPKDILESDLEGVKDCVDQLIDDGFKEWRDANHVAGDLADYIAPIMKRQTDYDKEFALFRKVNAFLNWQNRFVIIIISCSLFVQEFICLRSMSHESCVVNQGMRCSFKGGIRCFLFAEMETL